MTIFAELLTFARKLNNYAIDATGSGATGTTYWTDTTHYRATVPVGKRWWLIGGVTNRGVNATLEINAHNAAGGVISWLDTRAAATGQSNYPQYTLMTNRASLPLDADEYIEAVFGVAQDASSYMSCVVLEVDV